MQVSGAAVAADPTLFVKEFVLLSKPVVIRDLVLRPVTKKYPLFKRRADSLERSQRWWVYMCV